MMHGLFQYFTQRCFITQTVISSLLIFSLPHVFALEPVATLDSKASKNEFQQTYTILEQRPHNTKSFTQGWVIHEGIFYESSGLYGRSFLQRYTENSNATASLPKQYFAEGLTLLNNTLYVLTWKENVLLLIDPSTLSTLETKTYEGEGWGLTHNDHHLIMSNGTPKITFRNIDDFSIERSLIVKHHPKNIKKPLLKLNELEYIDGFIWANNWINDSLYAINSITGCIEHQIDLSELRKKAVRPNNRNVP